MPKTQHQYTTSHERGDGVGKDKSTAEVKSSTACVFISLLQTSVIIDPPDVDGASLLHLLKAGGHGNQLGALTREGGIHRGPSFSILKI